MKKQILCLTAALSTLLHGFALVGCDLTFTPPSPKDYNADVQIVAPEDITTEHFVVEEDTTYYTSPGFSLCMEVNGAFLIMDYFSLDGSKRVYDNLYFYERDYFYIVTDDYKDLYASLEDSADAEYAEEEKEQGYDIQINVKKEGIYKLTFDVETLKFDMEYKAEIETPVYYTIPNCSIFTLDTEWVEMHENPANADEFVIENFHVNAGELISFYNHVHVSNYKVTLHESCNEKLVSGEGKYVEANVGGTYNVSINRKTYVVSVQLVTADKDGYSCGYFDKPDYVMLTPVENIPYLFRLRVTVEKLDSLPILFSSGYRMYDLTIATPDLFFGDDFKEAGTYDLTIDLQAFTVSAEKLPE